MTKFSTGLLTFDFKEYPPPPFRGKGWKIVYRSADEHQRFQLRSGRKVSDRELLILAANPATAQKAATLVHAATLLLFPLQLTAQQFWIVKPFSQPRDDETPFFQCSIGELPKACMIAAKASFKKKHVYALHKFLLSTQLFCTDVQSLHPSKRDFQLSVFHDDHVRFAYAIVLAYAVIEEIGLEVRATKERPSRLKDGTWNPEVRTCLESRLEAAGVQHDKEIDWAKRGTPTRVEKKSPTRAAKKQPWAFGRVRDEQRPLIDAIAAASWLRSKVSAHRFSELLPSLSIYDVVNVQHLARRLLLESMGFWKHYGEVSDS